MQQLRTTKLGWQLFCKDSRIRKSKPKTREGVSSHLKILTNENSSPKIVSECYLKNILGDSFENPARIANRRRIRIEPPGRWREVVYGPGIMRPGVPRHGSRAKTKSPSQDGGVDAAEILVVLKQTRRWRRP